MKNGNTKFWYLNFHALWESSIERYNLYQKSYNVTVSKREGNVIFVLSSQEVFPAIFPNETVTLRCSISVLKTIYAKHKLRRPKCGIQWEYSEKYHSQNITFSPCKFISFDIKDFYPTITKELISKCLGFAKQKFKLQKMIRKLYTSRKNRYYLTEETRGWKKRGSIWCSSRGLWWCWSMRTCWYFFITKKLVKFVMKVILDYIGMTVEQFLETKVVLN